jgi:hypothetical protein
MIRRVDVLAAGALVLGLVGATAAQQPVAWTAQSNVSVRGNSIQKTGGCDGCEDAIAVSRQAIPSGNGFVEFRVDDPYTFWAAGLSRAGVNPRFNAIDFAWRFNGNGRADVIENGAYQPGSDTTANEGDIFQVAVTNGRVQYIQNANVIHESSRRPGYPLAFAAALGTVGTRVTDARIDTSGRGVVGTTGRYDSSYDDSTAFDDLDRNRNGYLTRAEFEGTAREFDRLDLNRDGRLSRSEWERGGGTSSTFDPRYNGADPRYNRADPRYNAGSRYDAGDYETYVEAREQWTDTGVWAQAGDLITFAADGTINLNQTGAQSAPSGSSYTTQNPPLRNAPVGVLIGRIGNSQPIALGNRRTLRAPVSGEVFLGVNDDVLEDNSGEYRVRISVQPR